MPGTLDPRTDEHLWRCPQREELIRLGSQLAICQVDRAGGCHGCRARKIFEGAHQLTGIILDFWARTDAWP